MAVAIGSLEDMLFFPYNSVENEFGEDDRLYDSQDWADYFKQFIGNGIFPNPANGLKVESLDNSMVLTLRAGASFADGRVYVQKKDFRFSATPAHLTLGRRDIVIARHDNINRTKQALYIEGTPSSVPVAPSIVRTDDIFDLLLAVITVNPNAQSISTANINTAVRLDPEVCGIVHGLVDQVDTTDIFNQYQTYLDEQIASWDTRKKEQKTDWQAQMTAQQSASDAQLAQQKNAWEAWFAKINVDIQIIATFDFGNLANLPFTEKLTSWPTGRQLETITVSGSSAKVAERELDFSTMIATERVYNSSGEVVRTATMKKLFLPDGSIKDVITL